MNIRSTIKCAKINSRPSRQRGYLGDIFSDRDNNHYTLRRLSSFYLKFKLVPTGSALLQLRYLCTTPKSTIFYFQKFSNIL